MRLLITAFYRDSARYFAELAKHIEQSRNIEVALEAISIYPCAQKYFDDNGIKSTYAPAVVDKDRSQPVSVDDGLLNELTSFHRKTYRYFGQDKNKKLAAVARNYILFLDELFKKSQFDRVIVFGSSRLLPKTVEHIARKHNIPVLYFEQAPFGRTILNSGGVGSKMRLPPRQKYDANTATSVSINSERSAKAHYWRFEDKTLALRRAQATTFLLSFQPKLIQKFLAPDLYTGPFYLLLKRGLAKRRLKYVSNLTTVDLPGRHIALFLQTPVDASFFEESPIYTDFTQMVEDVLQACPRSHHLIVREHPEHLGCYNPSLYDLINANTNATLNNSMPMAKLLDSCELVIVNNSTVGFQALAIGKKVMVLGSAFYSGKGITYDLLDRSGMHALLQHALLDSPCQDKAREFVEYMINDVFFNGHFQDQDLEFDERLIKMLVDYEKNI